MEIIEEEHAFFTKLQVPSHIYKYKWVIQNFNMCYTIEEKCIVSPIFEAVNNQFYMKLYPHGYDNSTYNNEYLSITLHNQTINNNPYSDLLIDFSILNHKSEIVHTERADRLDHSICKAVSCFRLMKRTSLHDASKNLFVDNQLTIVCAISKLNKSENASISYSPWMHNYNNDFSLSSELGEFLNNKLFADVTLVAKGEEFRAHKVVLAARSPVFASMLQADNEEQENCKIVIDDIDGYILSKLLEFMYTDKLYIAYKQFEDMLRVANKYDIKGLKNVCQQHLLRHLFDGNVIDIFMLADTYACELLKQEAFKIMIKSSRKIIESPKFESWKKALPAMIIDIIKAHA